MKIRVRINRQTSRVELQGAEPSVNDLSDVIRDTLLESHGLSSQTDFSLSLNGSDFLVDGGQTLASCGIVSGDLVNVVLPQPATPPISPAAAPPTAPPPSSSSSSVSEQQQQPSTSSQDSSTMPRSAPSAPVWEPMLCSEAEPGQAPLSLEFLYHMVRSPDDALMVAVHLLMLETGFVPQGGELRPDEMPAGWRLAGGAYKLQYLHPLCEGSVVTATAVSMGPLVVINMTLKVAEMVDTVQKLCVETGKYVSEQWSGESAAAAYRDLRTLSRVIKDQLAYPLITAARDAMALPVAFGLPTLPPELLLQVLRLLDVRSVVRLSAVSRHFNAATADSMLWKHLYCRDFGAPASNRNTSRDTDWKALYKNSYEMRCESRRLRRSFFQPIVLPGNVGSVPAVPGIIGGDYDTRPNLPYPLLPLRPRFDPIGPFADPIRPFFDPVGPFADPIGPFADPIRPFADPIRPFADPIRPFADPIGPFADPIGPFADPIRPFADPIGPLADPIRPFADPIRPLADPIRPFANPNRRPRRDARPLRPTGGWPFNGRRGFI